MSFYPQMFRLRQRFDGPRLDDVPAAVEAELSRLALDRKIHAGAERGHHRRQPRHRQHPPDHQGDRRALEVARRQAVHRAGDGQPRRRHGRRAARASSKATASPRSSAAARSAPAWRRSSSARRPKAFPSTSTSTPSGPTTCWSCGRVKPHTGFVGDIESGLMKMMLIGLGKHEGAKIYHRAIQDYSFGQIVRSVAGAGAAEVPHRRRRGHRRERLRRDGHDRGRRAATSSKPARRSCWCWPSSWMPRLPFKHGRPADRSTRSARTSAAPAWTPTSSAASTTTTRPPSDECPKVKRIIVRGLTEATHGNATGIGMAEFCRTPGRRADRPARSRGSTA